MGKCFSLTPPVADPIPRYGPLCCVQCFDHPWLSQYLTRHSRETGPCEFCGSQDVALIEVSTLSPYFANLMGIYSPVGPDNFNPNVEDPLEVGEPLDWLIDEDWSVFSERLSSNDRRMDLLEAILDARYTDSEWRNDKKGVLEVFDSLELYTSRQGVADYKLIDAWDEHKQEVMVRHGKAKPFRIGKGTLNRIANTLRSGINLYRARPGFNTVRRGGFSSAEEPYRDGEIGAPPKASTGRANRKDQVVLYCADQDATAVAEVRPAQGFFVSLGRFKAKRDLKLLDLVMSRPAINPFTDNDLRMAVETQALFEAFARDLETPLRRSDDDTTYLPSQNLTDAVRRAGFDGIRYPSAMNPGGSNIVLFDPADAEFVDSQLVEITSVNVKFEPWARAR